MASAFHDPDAQELGAMALAAIAQAHLLKASGRSTRFAISISIAKARRWWRIARRLEATANPQADPVDELARRVRSSKFVSGVAVQRVGNEVSLIITAASTYTPGRLREVITRMAPRMGYSLGGGWTGRHVDGRWQLAVALHPRD